MYHLHGHHRIVESLVLTEDDYIDFISNTSTQPDIIPPIVTDAITDGALLFLGYSLVDWNVRVLMRTLRQYLQNSTRQTTVAVQLRPTNLGGGITDLDRAVRFFERYFENQQIFIFWGTCQQFLQELRTMRGTFASVPASGVQHV